MPALADFPALYSSGHALEGGEDKLGFLETANDRLGDRAALAARMQEDGYLFLRGLLDRDEVLAARRAVLEPLEAQGKLDPDEPLMAGVPRAGVKLAFLPELAQKNNAPLQRLLYRPDGAMMTFFGGFLGGAVAHFDFTWLRCITPGPGTASHCDIVYMGRGTRRLYTAWVPLGDTDFELGGLMMLAGSHKNERLRATYGQTDVDSYCSNRPHDKARTAHGNIGALSSNPNQVRRSLGGRWLTTEYRAGDALIFCMDIVHSSLDNRTDRLRLSSDSRYQLASEPRDERWIGDNPPGHGPAGKRGRIC